MKERESSVYTFFFVRASWIAASLVKGSFFEKEKKRGYFLDYSVPRKDGARKWFRVFNEK